MARSRCGIALLMWAAVLVPGIQGAGAQDVAAAPTVRSYVFCQDGELWVADRDGENVTRIAGGPDFPRAELLYPSPNGRRIAWITEDEGELWVLERGGAIRWLGPVKGRRLKWSPDGEWIAILDGDLLVSPDTGSAMVVGGSAEGGYGWSYQRLEDWVPPHEMLIAGGGGNGRSPNDPEYGEQRPPHYRLEVRPLTSGLDASPDDRTLWEGAEPPVAAVSPSGGSVALWATTQVFVIDAPTGDQRLLTSDVPGPGSARAPSFLRVALAWSEDSRYLYACLGNRDAPTSVAEAWCIDTVAGEAPRLADPPRRTGPALPAPLRARLAADLSPYWMDWEQYLRGGQVVCAAPAPPEYWLPPATPEDARTLVHVTSAPSGAEIYLNGELVGISPCDIAITSFSDWAQRAPLLSAMQEGREIVARQLFPRPGETCEVELVLDEPFAGEAGDIREKTRAAIVHMDEEALLGLVGPQGVSIGVTGLPLLVREPYRAPGSGTLMLLSSEQLQTELSDPPRLAGATDGVTNLRDLIFGRLRSLFLRGMLRGWSTSLHTAPYYAARWQWGDTYSGPADVGVFPIDGAPYIGGIGYERGEW